MGKLNPKKTATAVGCFVATLALIRMIVLAIGGQSFINWAMSLHFVSVPLTVIPFSLVTAIVSIAVHWIVGALVGLLFATVWNRVNM